MKINIAAILIGTVTAQALLLGSGCQSPDVLAPRGYQVPQAEPDPIVNYEQTAVSAPERQAPPASLDSGLETEVFQAAPVAPQSAPPARRSPPRAIESTPVEYIVKKNDTLGSIGQRYGVSYAALAKYNNLDSKKYLRIGQVIKIPPPGTVIHVERAKPAARNTVAAPRQAAAVTAAAPAAGYTLTDGYYLVRRGDSVSKIAARFKVKRADLMKANNINENTILQIGQKLVIPGKSPGAVAASTRQPAVQDAPKPTAKPAVPPQSIPTASPALPTGQDAADILESVEDPMASPAAPSDDSAAALNTGAPTSPPASASLTNRKSIDIPGDTTWEQLAIMYGTSVEELKRLNPDVHDEKTVRAGRLLFIP